MKTDTIKHFIYIKEDGTVDSTYPFRVGDIVTINNWGLSYTTYRSAFFFFTKSINPPFYAVNLNQWNNKTPFKIIDIAKHSYNKEILLYIMDRFRRSAVIGVKGVTLLRQYPLKENEKQIVYLKKIPKLKQ